MSDRVATEALVLRRFDYGETSQTGRLFTRELGRVGVLAKGIKRPGTELRGPMDLLVLADVEIRLRRRSDLHLMTRYRVQTGFRGLRRVLDRLWAAFYVTEILREGTRDLDADPVLFDCSRATLFALEESRPDEVPSVVAWFELAYLDRAGFRPSLDRCVLCGRRAPEGRPVRFAPFRGGLVCRSCAGRRRMALVTLGSRLRTVLDRLRATPDPSTARSTTLAPDDRRILRLLFKRLLEGVLEKELRSAPFLR